MFNTLKHKAIGIRYATSQQNAPSQQPWPRKIWNNNPKQASKLCIYIYTYVKPPSQYHRFLMAEKAMSKNVRYQFLAVPCGKPGINCEQGETALKAV